MESGAEPLQAHYEATCALVAAARKTRDWLVYAITAAATVMLFDMHAPGTFSKVLESTITNQTGSSVAPDLAFMRTILWLVLLALTVRYGQSTLYVERAYAYIHRMEEELNKRHGGVMFTREGKAYLGEYPAFLNWAHYLYSLGFPLLIGAVVVARTMRELSVGNTTALTIFDVAFAAMTLVSIALFLKAFHFPKGVKREQND